MTATPESLESYLSGRWLRGEGVETTLVDPVTGDELATVSAKGLDLKGALDFARRQGQGALRELELCRARQARRRGRRRAGREPRAL